MDAPRKNERKQKEAKKRRYEEPALEAYGSATDITRQGGHPNADVPFGAPNTAYPPDPTGSPL